jgi:repressor LexA
MSKKELSERQQNILAFIADHTTRHRRPPTIREIGAEVGISSTSVVTYNLNRLAEQGLIERDAEVSRGLSLTRLALKLVGLDITNDRTLRVRLAGNIVAGEPIDFVTSDFSTYSDDDAVEIDAGMLRGTQTDNLFALRVSGHSMIDAMVDDGDIVIMRQQSNAINGDMVAAWITPDDTTTLKYYFLEQERVRLQPANPTMEPIYLEPERVNIQGKVEMVIRRL